MARIRFMYVNRWSENTSTVAASSAATRLPAAASQNPDRSYVWRSLTQAGVQTLDIDLGSALSASSIALADPKIVGAGVIELYQRGSAASPGAATLVATLPTKDAETGIACAFFTQATYRHWQLKWTNPGGASDYAEVGYVSLGDYLEPAVNVTVPMRGAFNDPSIVQRSTDGQKSITDRSGYFEGSFAWNNVAQADFDDLREMYETVGIRRAIFVWLDTTLPWTAVLMNFSGMFNFEYSDIYGRYSCVMPYEETR